MPIGVYERTEEHKKKLRRPRNGSGIYKRTKEMKLNMSKGAIKRFAKMTKKERQQVTKACVVAMKKKWAKTIKEERQQAADRWQKAGTEGMIKKFVKMTKEERLNFMLPPIIAARKRWNRISKEQRLEHVLPATIAAQRANPSSIEKMIWIELDKLNIKYEVQVPFANGRFIVDIYISAQRLIIECNGTYWHNYEIFPEKKIRDELVEKYVNIIGLKIAWLWESEIRKDSRQALIGALLY